jgi:hypothetical protein
MGGVGDSDIRESLVIEEVDHVSKRCYNETVLNISRGKTVMTYLPSLGTHLKLWLGLIKSSGTSASVSLDASRRPTSIPKAVAVSTSNNSPFAYRWRNVLFWKSEVQFSRQSSKTMVFIELSADWRESGPQTLAMQSTKLFLTVGFELRFWKSPNTTL